MSTSVVRMLNMHPVSWMSTMGSSVSSTSVSREKRLMMRPEGVESKNVWGRVITRSSMWPCSTREALVEKK